MKSVICSLIIFICTITSVNAQNYQNVVCGNCRGAGGWMTMYGAVVCQACGGYGYVSVPVQNTTSFRGNGSSGYRPKYYNVTLYSHYNSRWNEVTRYAKLYKDEKGVWKVRLDNVDYLVKNGPNYYGKSQYIYIGMGHFTIYKKQMF